MITTIPTIKEKLCGEIGYQHEHIIVSLLHRVKTKENPHVKILNFLKKKHISISIELEQYIHLIDFEDITKSKHGGRGQDKKERRTQRTKTQKGYRDYYSFDAVDMNDTLNY